MGRMLALNLLVETIGDICARNAPTKKCKNKNISSLFKPRKVLMRKRRKLINRFSKHGAVGFIELEILQSHKDENKQFTVSKQTPTISSNMQRNLLSLIPRLVST